VVLIIAVSAMGWWRPVLFEREKATPRWLLIGPILMALTAVAFLLSKDYSNTTTTMVLLLVMGSIGVGFCEETATRGVLLTGFRGRFTEPWVWFWSTALFGLLHLPNAFFGAGISAVGQVFLAFAGGTMFYILRRVSGTLIWAMLLHGFWDFASFIGDGGETTAILVFVNGAVALWLVWVLLRKERGLRIVPLGARPEKQPA
jgi:membrane protease YdiL (CAAX protease family)